jgi:trehalose 6-phosphate synthase/phosphatase
VQGFNATVTGPVEKKSDQKTDQVRDMKLGLHTDIKEPLKTLCAEENTDVVILSGSERKILDEVFITYLLEFPKCMK